MMALPVMVLQGCSTIAYYAQAVHGHLEMIGQARPVELVERDPATPARLRERLALAREIREFASRALGLPDNGSYRRYADIGRPYVVWNVISTPEFSAEPFEHCFPVAGCVGYLGYYAEAAARSAAAREAALGRDAYVGGVPAYSTLGWFDDPLLSTFVFQPDVELARLVFHELAHQVAYVKDDTVFNESFASVVEEEGVRRWLEQREAAAAPPANAAKPAGPAASAATAAFEQYRAARVRRQALTTLLMDYRERLRGMYAASADDAARRSAKAAQFAALAADYARLKASWGGFAGYDRLFAGGANNALLASVAAYNELVPAFSAVLEAQQRDLPAFYKVVRELAALPPAERRRRLSALR
ncbi:MAG: aminopeptidase [Betaproteobacteria bacterium]|nr:aminopeptidase [Betaproteobacteria bacterium]